VDLSNCSSWEIDGKDLPIALFASVLEKYVYTNGMLTGRMDSEGDLLQYFHDGLGSITMIVDSTGSYQNLYTYDDFGDFRKKDEEVSNSYCYTGQERDEEPSGLYNLRARYYASGMGRFTQEDPVFGVDIDDFNTSCCSPTSSSPMILTYYPQDNNMYQYCKNSPIMFTDITGKFCGPGKIGEWAFPIPNRYPGFDFTEACRKHDQCYAKFCGVSKAFCDQQFLQDMQSECYKIPKARYMPNPFINSCLGMAQIYYYAVAGPAGWMAYKISQRKACKCIWDFSDSYSG